MVSNQIDGTGTVLVNQGSSDIFAGNVTTLAHSNTYTGATTVGINNALAISADNNLGTAPGSPTPGQLILGGEGGPGYAAGGVLQITGSGFTLNGNRGIQIGTGYPNEPDMSTFDVAGGATLTYAGIIAGTGSNSNNGNGSLAKDGAGTLVLSGASTFTGLNIYRPNIYSSHALATAVPTGGTASMILMNGKLVLGADSGPSGGPLGTGALLITGGANAVTLTANNGATGWTLASPVLFNSSVTLGDASNDALALSGPGTLIGNSATVTLTTPGNGVTLSGNIGESGAGMALDKAGPGTLVLSGSNNYSGGTVVEQWHAGGDAACFTAGLCHELPGHRRERGNARRVHRQLDFRQHRRPPTQLGVRDEQTGHRRSQRNVYL